MTEITTLPVASIASAKHNRRIDKDSLNEFAESIKTHGVLSPVLVRPMNGAHELVFGERRLRAAKSLGLETIPALVREMTDVEAIEARIIENLQRADVHPLEEGDSYRLLCEEHGYAVDDVAAKVGKSKAYVYSRMKLCALEESSRKAFLEDKLSASVALLVARMPTAKLQKKATAKLLRGNREGEPFSYRDAARMLQDEFMLRLADAPFSKTDAELVPSAGACSACPKRTGSQPELFPDVKSADVCTDPTCYRGKRDAFWATLKVVWRHVLALVEHGIPEKASRAVMERRGIKLGAGYYGRGEVEEAARRREELQRGRAPGAAPGVPSSRPSPMGVEAPDVAEAGHGSGASSTFRKRKGGQEVTTPAPKTRRRCPACGDDFVAGPYAKSCPSCRTKRRLEALLKQQKYVWTQEKDAFLRERYDGKVKGRAVKIAALWGWPDWAIRKRAVQLGLTTLGRRDWTPKEVRFLEEHVGRRTIHWIAKQLERPETSVVLKCERMKLSRRFRDGFTLRDLTFCFGCDRRVIERWVSKGMLRARRRGTLRAHDAWHVTEGDIVRFLRKHPTAFRLDKVDQLWFMDLVLGGGLLRVPKDEPRTRSGLGVGQTRATLGRDLAS